MSSTKIKIPDLPFTGIYYPDVVRDLRNFNRINAPEIKSEIPEEPFIQLERAFALVHHYDATLLDSVAGETLLPTLRLQDSARQILKLIAYQLLDYSPATAELIGKLTQPLTGSTNVVEEGATFATQSTEETPQVHFEVLNGLTVGATNVLSKAHGVITDRDGSDGRVVVGDADIFESATGAFTGGDIGKQMKLTGSTLGNSGVYIIVEIVSSTRVRLTGAFGLAPPLFLPEVSLDWVIYEIQADGSTTVSAVGGGSWDPWNGATPVAGDSFVIGLTEAMWNAMALIFITPALGITGVWEFFDPDEIDTTPEEVTNLGTKLRVDCTSLLGSNNRSGALVRLTFLPTGQSEVLESTRVSTKNVIDSSAFLGQTGTPSTDPDDYAIGTLWNPLPDIDDDTVNLTQDESVGWTLPQDPDLNWSKVGIADTEAFWLRYRVVSVTGTPTAPDIDFIDITTGDQFVKMESVQGQTVGSEPLQSGFGTANQTFLLSQTPALRDSVQMFVDEGGEIEWTNLAAQGELTLLSSGPNDRHFVAEINSLGEVTVRTGDGTHGKKVPVGVDNVRFVYRVGASDNGNVASDTVTINSSGSSLLSTVTNPRPASGWKESEGATEESLAILKEAAPASLRTLKRAVTAPDYEDLAVAFTTSAGTRPVARAKAIVEAYGPKTVKLIVVGTNGSQLTQTERDELEEYYNGTSTEPGVAASNTEVTVVNFTPRILSLALTCIADTRLSEDLIKTALVGLISPVARASDGQTFIWRFKGRVPLSRIASEIFNIVPGAALDVDVTNPAVDIELAEDELPQLDTSTITISIQAPT